MTIMSKKAMGPYGFGCTVQQIDSLFCADDGLLVSTRPEWIQWEFDVLTGVFYWVVLWKNFQNTVVMVCHP